MTRCWARACLIACRSINGRVNSLFARIKKIQEFLTEGEFDRHEQQKASRGRRIAHFWVLVFRSFQKNRGPVRAAALAYTSLLALIPLLAVAVSVSTGFLQAEGGEETIRDLVDMFVETAAPQLNLIQMDEEEAFYASIEEGGDVAERIHEYINRVNSGTLGITAGIALVFIAVTVLSTIEATFNDMWGISRGRSWSSRIVQYWAAITLGPLFIVSAVTLTATSTNEAEGEITPKEAAQIGAAALTNSASPGVIGGTNAARVIARAKNGEPEQTAGQRFVSRFIIPCFVLSLFLTLVYKLMPATKVMWSAAAVGGLFGGCVLQLNSLFSVIYISRVVTYSKIYGGLGVIPILLVGLYFSWLIVLLGAQVSYAFQNKQAYVQERQAESINQRGREFVALRLMTYIAAEFQAGRKPPAGLQLSTQLGVPFQVACNVLTALVKSRLLIEVQGEEPRYAPAKPLDCISEEDILMALRSGQGTEISTSDDPARAIVREEYERIQSAEMHAAGAVTLNTLVQRLNSLPPGERSAELEKRAANFAAA